MNFQKKVEHLVFQNNFAAIKELGDTAVKPLIAILERDYEMYNLNYEILGKPLRVLIRLRKTVSEENQIQICIFLIGHPWWSVNYKACSKGYNDLCGFGEKALPQLIEASETGDGLRRASVVKLAGTLLQRDPDSAVAFLSRVMETENLIKVLTSAVETASDIWPKIRKAKDAKKLIRLIINSFVVESTPELHRRNKAIRKFLDAAGKSAYEQILDALKASENFTIKYAIADYLADKRRKINLPEAVEPLSEFLYNPMVNFPALTEKTLDAMEKVGGERTKNFKSVIYEGLRGMDPTYALKLGLEGTRNTLMRYLSLVATVANNQQLEEDRKKCAVFYKNLVAKHKVRSERIELKVKLPTTLKPLPKNTLFRGIPRRALA